MTKQPDTNDIETAVPDVVDPLIGRELNGKFSLTELIAKGGMGAVYKAKQAPLGRLCAVKVLTPKADQPESFSANFHKRFFLEASTAARLTHPNTVTIYDYGKTTDGVYFMAMEYLEGATLAKAIKRDGPFSEERAIHIGLQICRSLREAHAMGVIHRDIKPANVYLIEHGDEVDFVKVLDFGLVKDIEPDANTEELTQAGLFMGSPRYMSPEQIQGLSVDTRGDIYSLGIVLYEMVAGRPPFDKGNSIEILMGHMKVTPPALREINPLCQVSQSFEDVILRCLAKNPSDRFSSMDELMVALRQCAKQLTGGTLFATAEYQAVSGSGSHTVGTSSGHHVFTASGSHSVPLAAPVAPATSSYKAIAFLVAAVLTSAIVAAVTVKVSSTGSSNASQSATQSAQLAPVEPTGQKSAQPEITAETPKPKAIENKVHIASEPAGASVRLDNDKGKELCQTPCDVTLEAGKSEQVVVLVKQGFVQTTKTLKASEPKLNVSMPKLSAVPVEVKKTNPGGYKELPPY